MTLTLGDLAAHHGSNLGLSIVTRTLSLPVGMVTPTPAVDTGYVRSEYCQPTLPSPYPSTEAFAPVDENNDGVIDKHEWARGSTDITLARGSIEVTLVSPLHCLGQA